MIAPFGETVQRDDESCPWGKLLQLSEKAEDSRRPKKCLAKQSAAAQRKRCCKRCRAASLADASPRLARGRSENIWIRLTRQRRDFNRLQNKLHEITRKNTEGGEWGRRWEKACNAGVNILFEANTKTLMINRQNSFETIQVTPLTTQQVLVIRADLRNVLSNTADSDWANRSVYFTLRSFCRKHSLIT